MQKLRIKSIRCMFFDIFQQKIFSLFIHSLVSHSRLIQQGKSSEQKKLYFCYLETIYNIFFIFYYFFFMQSKIQKAVIIRQYGKKPQYKEDYPMPTLRDGELLIKVEGSTINPSDRLIIQGILFKRSLPAVCGLEGTGTVVEAKGEDLQNWVGKRVCFKSETGSWCQYTVSSPLTTFEIDKDVPLCSASSGTVNPLVALGFIQTFKKSGCKGIIMTAGASSLGRMVIRLCLKESIPLLSLVRKQDQVYQLKKQGATHILVTKGGWQKDLKEYIQKYGFDFAFDALGGGTITETIINSLGPHSQYRLFSTLQKKPFHLQNPYVLYSVSVGGFFMWDWWASTSEETRKRIRSQYSKLLKNELRTTTYKQISLKEIEDGIDLSVSKACEGKILLRIQ